VNILPFLVLILVSLNTLHISEKIPLFVKREPIF